MKYLNAEVTFAEVPDEISLCISITGCPNKCKNCNQQELWEDIGIEITKEELKRLISKNKGITAVCILGGDQDPKYVNELAKIVKDTNLKFCWYSGCSTLSVYTDLDNFDYIKLGSYIEEFGPLTSETTNQRFYRVFHRQLIDETYKFNGRH